MRRPEQEAAQSELLEPPSVIERRLRARLGELVAAQAVEDEAGRAGLRGGVAGPGLYHRYNAVLKRVTGDKSRAQMTLSELEAAIGWLERNRLLTACTCWRAIPATPGRPASAASGSRRSAAPMPSAARLRQFCDAAQQILTWPGLHFDPLLTIFGLRHRGLPLCLQDVSSLNLAAPSGAAFF